MLSAFLSSVPTCIPLDCTLSSLAMTRAPAFSPSCPPSHPHHAHPQVPASHSWCHMSQARGTGLGLVSALKQQTRGTGLPLSSAAAASLGTHAPPEESSPHQDIWPGKLVTWPGTMQLSDGQETGLHGLDRPAGSQTIPWFFCLRLPCLCTLLFIKDNQIYQSRA